MALYLVYFNLVIRCEADEMEEEEIFFKTRFAKADEWEEIISLVWKTFLEFESDIYSEQGIESFRQFVTDTMLKRMFDIGKYQVMVAHIREKIIGVIALRDENHVSLLFVDKDYHYHGVGRALVTEMSNYVRNELDKQRLTVNASPYAVGFYHKLGFRDLGEETQADGIIYTPMELLL